MMILKVSIYLHKYAVRDTNWGWDFFAFLMYTFNIQDKQCNVQNWHIMFQVGRLAKYQHRYIHGT